MAGEGRSVRLVATARDAAGNPLAGEPVSLHAERGELGKVKDAGDGRYVSRLKVPDRLESGAIEVKAILRSGHPPSAPTRLDVTADPSVVPTSWRAFSLITASVTDGTARR